MKTEDSLKPCHCGERAFVALLNDVRQVWCSRDLCWKGPLRETEAEAVAAWNARVAPPEDDPEPPKDDEDEYGPDREETDDR